MRLTNTRPRLLCCPKVEFEDTCKLHSADGLDECHVPCAMCVDECHVQRRFPPREDIKTIPVWTCNGNWRTNKSYLPIMPVESLKLRLMNSRYYHGRKTITETWNLLRMDGDYLVRVGPVDAL